MAWRSWPTAARTRWRSRTPSGPPGRRWRPTSWVRFGRRWAGEVTRRTTMARSLRMTHNGQNGRRRRRVVVTGMGTLNPLRQTVQEDWDRLIAGRNVAAAHVAMEPRAGGPNSPVVTACAASTNAIGNAFRTIERGDADVMLAGGTEASLCEVGIASFNAIRALSTRNDAPERASRPFDAGRDGFVPGEGAAPLVLESLEHALPPDAPLHAPVT